MSESHLLARRVETDRLSVMVLQSVAPDSACPSNVRDLWLGFERRGGGMRVTVWATVGRPLREYAFGCDRDDIRRYVDYIETCDGCRRQGFARELWQAMDKHYGGVAGLFDRPSEAGEGLLAAVNGWALRPSGEPWRPGG
ncbi:MAG: hypothetical protein ACF8R7_08405 [Phycisphaerales bacterium JB039]